MVGEMRHQKRMREKFIHWNHHDKKIWKTLVCDVWNRCFDLIKSHYTVTSATADRTNIHCMQRPKLYMRVDRRDHLTWCVLKIRFFWVFLFYIYIYIYIYIFYIYIYILIYIYFIYIYIYIYINIYLYIYIYKYIYLYKINSVGVRLPDDPIRWNFSRFPTRDLS